MKHFTMATILSAILATGLATGLATAATAHSSSVTTQQVKETAQIAVQGLNALRDVKLARIALFQGNPQKAESLTNHAATLLADDSVDWVKFVHTDKKANLKDDKYVAIDASIGISEDYIASSEKQEVIKRANDKIKNGDSKGAIEELRLANIGVIENICLMPLKQTRKAVTEAQKLMGEHKYYEANLALKGAEDGVIMDSSAIFTN